MRRIYLAVVMVIFVLSGASHVQGQSAQPVSLPLSY